MQPATFFSILVTCYNMEKYIGDCLQSLVSQDYPADRYEIVCVDDGSTDGSAKIIDRFRQKNPNMMVIRTENSGLEKSCNRGIRASRHPHLVRVDADDRLPKNFLKTMDGAIQAHPGFDFYYCKEYVEYYSEAEQYRRELPDFDAEEVFCRGDFFATGTVYKKSDLEDVGFFPEAIKNCGLENYTVILALLSGKKRGLAVAGASFFYRRHGLNMSTVKKDAILRFGHHLLSQYGRPFRTNEYHPYNLQVKA